MQEREIKLYGLQRDRKVGELQGQQEQLAELISNTEKLQLESIRRFSSDCVFRLLCGLALRSVSSRLLLLPQWDPLLLLILLLLLVFPSPLLSPQLLLLLIPLRSSQR